MFNLAFNMKKAYPTAMFYFEWAMKTKNVRLAKKCIKEMKKGPRTNCRECVEVVK